MSPFILMLLTWNVAPPCAASEPPDRTESELRSMLWHAGRETGLGRDVILDLIPAAQQLADAEWETDELASKSGGAFVGPRQLVSRPLRRLVASRADLRGLPFERERDAAR